MTTKKRLEYIRTAIDEAYDRAVMMAGNEDIDEATRQQLRELADRLSADIAQLRRMEGDQA